MIFQSVKDAAGMGRFSTVATTFVMPLGSVFTVMEWPFVQNAGVMVMFNIMFILEGPDSANLRGWRHYQIVFDGRRSCVLSRPMDLEHAATKYRAKCFPRGTWEDVSKTVPPDTMPVPRREVLDEIYGSTSKTKQMEFA